MKNYRLEFILDQTLIRRKKQWIHIAAETRGEARKLADECVARRRGWPWVECGLAEIGDSDASPGEAKILGYEDDQ